MASLTTARRRYAALSALAHDQVGTPEGDSAARAAAALLSAYGSEALTQGLDSAGQVELVKRTIAWRHEGDRSLGIMIATFLGLDPKRNGYAREDRPGETRWRNQTDATGPVELVELWVQLYEEHRARMAEIMEWAGLGYAMGAFPQPPSEDGDEDEDRPPMDPAHVQAAMAAQELGRRHQATVPIPESRRLTTAGS